MPITELRIEGLRTIEKIRLPLEGLTVLIGENGSGKSSIIEACEILRRATGPRFMDELHAIHGGLAGLLRQGAKRLLIGVTIRPDEKEIDDVITGGAPSEQIEYDLVVAETGALEEVTRLGRAWGPTMPSGARLI